MNTLEELKVDYYAKQTAFWDAGDLANKYKHEFLAAEKAYRKAREDLDKEWWKTNDL
tara:strand:- start:323 stop:493 length:171 start_codon:yes stop_codon:yes gene_type:complete